MEETRDVTVVRHVIHYEPYASRSDVISPPTYSGSHLEYVGGSTRVGVLVFSFFFIVFFCCVLFYRFLCFFVFFCAFLCFFVPHDSLGCLLVTLDALPPRVGLPGSPEEWYLWAVLPMMALVMAASAPIALFREPFSGSAGGVTRLGSHDVSGEQAGALTDPMLPFEVRCVSGLSRQ